MHTAASSRPLSVLYICVDEYGAGRMEGRIYCPCLYEPLLFHDANNFFIHMEEMMEYPCYPQAFQRKRAFGDEASRPAPLMPDAENLHRDKRGKVATGMVHIISRQNTSWQGFILWLDVDRRDAFSSDLELLSLVHEKCGG